MRREIIIADDAHEKGLHVVEYEETEHYRLTRDFLNSRDRYFKHLFGSPDDHD